MQPHNALLPIFASGRLFFVFSVVTSFSSVYHEGYFLEQNRLLDIKGAFNLGHLVRGAFLRRDLLCHDIRFLGGEFYGRF